MYSDYFYDLDLWPTHPFGFLFKYFDEKNSKMPIYEVTAFVPLDVDDAWLVSDFYYFLVKGSNGTIWSEDSWVGSTGYENENPSLEYMKSHMNDLIVTKCFSRATMHSIK